MYYEQQEADPDCVYITTLRRSKKLRKCHFCGYYIRPGQVYERHFGKHDKGDKPSTFDGHVNASCLSGG